MDNGKYGAGHETIGHHGDSGELSCDNSNMGPVTTDFPIFEERGGVWVFNGDLYCCKPVL